MPDNSGGLAPPTDSELIPTSKSTEFGTLAGNEVLKLGHSFLVGKWHSQEQAPLSQNAAGLERIQVLLPW